MENTENLKATATEEPTLVISKESIGYLTETRKWTMFFSILGFVFIGLMAIAAIAMAVAGIVGNGFTGFKGPGLYGFLGLTYIILGVIYIFPVLYLLKFSTRMKNALDRFSSNDLTLAFQNLKSHMKFVGIMTIVLIALYILVIVFAISVGLSSLFH